jgi:hypothetical protein
VAYEVDAYDLDLFDVSASLIDELHDADRRVICYFSAGSFENFREDADEFLADELGNVLDDFADERWLDVRSSRTSSSNTTGFLPSRLTPAGWPSASKTTSSRSPNWSTTSISV